MKKIMIKANNWTGKEVEVKVFADGSFEVYDSKFKFNRSGNVVSADGNWSADDVMVEMVDVDDRFVGRAYDVERWSNNRIETAVQVLSNII